MRFWNFIKNEQTGEVELRIEGEIVDDDIAWLYEWFGITAASPNAFRESLAEHKGKDITVWINSWGGDTTAAAGIYNALKEHDGKITVKIDGKAVSAASVIAMAGDEVKMSPVGIMMVHNPWSGVRGEARDMRHMADILDEVKDTIINAYQIKTKRSRKKISDMMDEETWMSPKKALAEGFIDEILYTETEPAAIENSFMFSRTAIQNSATKSMRRFIEQYNKLVPPEPPEPSWDMINQKLAELKSLLDKSLGTTNEEQTEQIKGFFNELITQLPEPPEPPNNNPVPQRQPPLSLFQDQIQVNKNRLRR